MLARMVHRLSRIVDMNQNVARTQAEITLSKSCAKSHSGDSAVQMTPNGEVVAAGPIVES